jgi:catechol 2,3-dioxygenase-like lactoylglutathione lyase family enzyme
VRVVRDLRLGRALVTVGDGGREDEQRDAHRQQEAAEVARHGEMAFLGCLRSFPLGIGLCRSIATRFGRTYDAGMAKARLVGINHVALEVGDLDAALDLYGRLFDFELRGRVRGMAFLDMGDQFLALAESDRTAPDDDRHFGLVVDDRDAVRAALLEAGLKPQGNLRFTDPWGNQVELVEYADVQFTKADAVLRGMGLGGLGKSEKAQRELADKGLA